VYLQLKEMLTERLRSSPAEWFHEGSTTPMWDSKKMPAKPEWQMQCAITHAQDPPHPPLPGLSASAPGTLCRCCPSAAACLLDSCAIAHAQIRPGASTDAPCLRASASSK
jgi:hypothetical protein